MKYIDYAMSMHDSQRSYYRFLLCSEDVGKHSSVNVFITEAYEVLQDNDISFMFCDKRYFNINGFVMVIHDAISDYPVIETNKSLLNRVNLYGQDYPNRRSWYLNRANLMMMEKEI